MPDPDPGVTAPPAEPAAEPAVPAPTSEPSGGEAVTSTGKPEEQTVPFARFQEVNDKAKAETEAREKAEKELATLKEQQTQTPQNEDEVEPDVLDLVKKSAGKLGLVSKEELDAREAQLQVKQDISDLTSQYKESGIPFDGKAVIDYANTNGMPIGSKKSLDAVYLEMNREAIIEAQRKAAVTEFQESAKNGGEKPGPKGAQPPADKEPSSLKDRIKAAREKAKVSIT